MLCREYTHINSRELDYNYDDSEEGTSLQIDKYRIHGHVDDVSELVSLSTIEFDEIWEACFEPFLMM